MANDGTPALNFDTAHLENATTGVTRPFDMTKDALLPYGATAFFLVLIAASYLWAKKNRAQSSSRELVPRISSWPVGLKLSLIPLLSAYALTHLFSAASVYYNTKVASPTTIAYFEAMGRGRLFSLTHAHLFAHATMYFLLAVLVQGTRRGPLVRVLAPIAALWAGVFDVFSWWGLKELSPSFEILSALSGISFSLGFVIMGFAIFCEIFSQDTLVQGHDSRSR
ncbi:MAG: hypothetical protein ABIR96_08725 [Bdellovibrionota bacterium]